MHKNKVAIVTGASRGIGAATAKLLSLNGYAVCVTYFTGKKQADDVINEINKQHGTAIAVKADISIESDIVNLFNEVNKQLGPVTALINNAGINGGTCEVENITADHLQSVFATNVFGTIYACREAIKQMKQQGGGNIINISSEAARFGGTKLAHYASSKAAINTFTIAFAREIAAYNIRVNTISPGVIDTEIHASSSPERIANLINSIPMKRMGKTTEVAELILWLLSDAASYVSGAIIPVTGAR
jgi:NAD(P)-dependent dehydrogenase (short-subunit alcohol dehydrogenase family)